MYVTNIFVSYLAFVPGVLPRSLSVWRLHFKNKTYSICVQCFWMTAIEVTEALCNYELLEFCCPGFFSWWYILHEDWVLQKPLVRHPGDALTLEKVRQCEIHMQPKRENCCRSWLSKFPTRSKRIDVISRITFPLVFAVFNLVYWSTYLFREETEDNWATVVCGRSSSYLLSNRIAQLKMLPMLPVLKFRHYELKKVD